MLVNGVDVLNPEQPINPNIEINMLRQKNKELQERLRAYEMQNNSSSRVKPRLKSVYTSNDNTNIKDIAYIESLEQKVAQLEQRLLENCLNDFSSDNIFENNDGVSLDQYNALQRKYENLQEEIKEKDKQLTILRNKLDLIKSKYMETETMISGFKNTAKKVTDNKAMKKSAMILEIAIKYNKTPSEIIKETGFSKTTVYNALSVTKDNDKERIKQIGMMFPTLFDGVDIISWYESQVIKKLHLLTYEEVKTRTGFKYVFDNKLKNRINQG